MACELFGYEESELTGLLLSELVRLKTRNQSTILESHLEPCGTVVNVNGKVVSVLSNQKYFFRRNFANLLFFNLNVVFLCLIK